MPAPTAPNAKRGSAGRRMVVKRSPVRPRAPSGALPRAVADTASTVPRAIEWLAGANPSCRKTRAPRAGTAQPRAAARRRRPALDRIAAIRASAAAAVTQIQALVDVTHAMAASRAASFMRPLTAARAAPETRAVISGSTTAEPDVNRNTGLSIRRTTAKRACLTFGARRETQA